MPDQRHSLPGTHDAGVPRRAHDAGVDGRQPEPEEAEAHDHRRGRGPEDQPVPSRRRPRARCRHEPGGADAHTRGIAKEAPHGHHERERGKARPGRGASRPGSSR